MLKPRGGNFQALAGEQGRWWEDTCRRALTAAGFLITHTHQEIADAGVEVDLIAHNTDEIAFYVTCKGSFQSDRNGCERTDTLRKAVAEAYALTQCGFGPVVLLTSHLPLTRRARAFLAIIDPAVLFEALDPLRSAKRLRWLAQATEAQLQADLTERRNQYLAHLPVSAHQRWADFTAICAPTNALS